MRNGNLHRFVALWLAILMIGPTRFAMAKPKKELRIGVILRFDDKFNSTVDSIQTGIEAARRLYEEEHNGVKIKVQRFTHGIELASVVAASAKVVESHVPAIIGGELSEESYVIGDQLAVDKVVFITPTSSTPILTANKPYVFLACFSDDQVAAKLARFTFERLKPGAVGVLHNLSSPYTDYLSKRFIEEYQTIKKEKGLEVPLYEEKILRHTQDFKNQIRTFMEKRVTHVIMLTHESDFFTFFTQAAQQNYFPAYIGSDGWGSNQGVFENLVKGAQGGEHFVGYRNNYWKEDSSTPIGTRFVAKYKKIFGHKPNAWSAISFDAAWLLFLAMDRAKNPNDSTQIQSELKKIKGLSLVTTSNFSFSEDNTPRKDLYIYEIDKTGIRYKETLK
jgi:branched-chain amino acid transport system substrate-binding protein